MSAIECPLYESDGTRRCRSYIDGGTCARPDQFVCTEWQRANAKKPERIAPVIQLRPKQAVRNEHWSFSRLSRFESCRLAYKLHYVDKLASEPGEPLQFGKAVHAALERLYVEHMLDERNGALDVRRAVELFQSEWSAAALVGPALFRDGVEMIERYCRGQGVVDARSVLAVEKEFRLPIGSGEVLGYIDRIVRIDDETIEVVDYKTNRQLFAREEVDESLQLGLYELAVRRLYPWVKHVRLSYVMLRHGSVKQTMSRTAEQLRAIDLYAASLGAAMDAATEFPSRIGPNCVYCDHRKRCDAYGALLAEPTESLATVGEDLAALSEERQRVAARAKILYARREEIDRILKAHLKQKDELVVGSTRYAMLKITSQRHPLDATLASVAAATGREERELVRELCMVDKDRLDALLKREREKLGASRAALLRAELDANAEQTLTTRLWAKSLKQESLTRKDAEHTSA
jgi:RecB family exonuclease